MIDQKPTNVQWARESRSSATNRRTLRSRRRGFTLIELLVVITIILIVSAVALPTVLPALSHRQVSEGARLLQAALAGARDSAIKNNKPSGIRLLPDPTFSGVNPTTGLVDPTLPLASNRIIPIAAAPDYSEGLLTAWQGALPAVLNAPTCLMVFESIVDNNGLLANPTSWFWNVRVGDKIQINNAGPYYTVVGPNIQTVGNSELFVNGGLPGAKSLLQGANGTFPEYLLLVNGKDDDANGWIDSGFDGVDNNGVNGVDELAEWEQEVWLGAVATVGAKNVPYTIRRRPAPTSNAREITLPTNVVVDLTTGTTQERSRLTVNPFTGYVDVVVNPNGTAVLTTLYSTPAIVGMAGSFLHFWLAERSDVYAPTANSVSTNGTFAPHLPLPQGIAPAAFNGVEIKGEYRLVTLFTRTGLVTTDDIVPFDPGAQGPTSNIGTAAYNTNFPYIQAQRGVRGGQ